MTDESRQLTNGDAKKVTKAANQVWSAVRLVVVLCVAIVVFQFALQWQIRKLDNNTSAAVDKTDELKGSVTHVEDVVSELEQFVNSLQEITPEEQVDSEAVQRAVSLVPVILSILCDLAPQSPDCQGR